MGVLKEYSAINVVRKVTMPINVPQNEKVRMGMLKECVLDVVTKGIMPIVVQQSIRRPGPVMLDYTASSFEKMNILPVGVKKEGDK